MNINQYLKSVGKTKMELAEDIKISRPTLNQYIEQFESGKPIENERYNIIFSRLFSDLEAEKSTFDEELKAVKFLLDRDEKYNIGILETEAADLIAFIHNIMIRDMEKKQWNKKVYEFIIILLNNYKNNEIMREMAGYFYDLNSESDLSDLSDSSKAYYSYYYSCFRKIIDKAPQYDSMEYEDYLIRRSQIAEEREKRNRKKAEIVKRKINTTITSVEQDFKNKGVELSEEDLVAEVMRRMSNKEEDGIN